MRLFLIPISTRRALIYARPLRRDSPKELSLLDRVTSKAAKTWASWEETEKGWKKQLVTWGNRVQQRIPFEEWGLKSIPSLKAQRRLDNDHGKKKIDVLFPGNSLWLDRIPSVLRTIATERQQLHRKRMWWSFAAAPITLPFVLVPVYVARSASTGRTMLIEAMAQNPEYSLLLSGLPRVVALARWVVPFSLSPI